MVKKVKKIVEETLKKAKKIKEQSGAPEPGTVGARKTTPKVAPKPKAKAKPNHVEDQKVLKTNLKLNQEWWLTTKVK